MTEDNQTDPITEIIKHAKYNAVIFTGLDTEGAHKNTEYEAQQIRQLITKEKIEVLKPLAGTRNFTGMAAQNQLNRLTSQLKDKL